MPEIQCADLVGLAVEARKGLKEDGYYIIPGAYSNEFCSRAVDLIDSKGESDPNVEMGHLGTMKRVWGAQKLDPAIDGFYRDAAALLSLIFKRDMYPKTVLAQSDRARHFETQEEYAAFSKGRWHYDSWRDQYKVFVFLRDVGVENGPFQFVTKTGGWFKRRLACKPGVLINPLTHFLTKLRPYQSLDDKLVDGIIASGHAPVSATVPAGTAIVVNPSALIHRAMPIQSGSRYVCVAYF